MTSEKTIQRPLATLSLDLDNLWSYLKIYGNPSWETFPSYLPQLVPLVCDLFQKHGLKITFFIVGQDAALKNNLPWLRKIASAGHEVGNHSFYHEPWMSTQNIKMIEEELQKSHQAIIEATGLKPVGFRGPGFCQSSALLTSVLNLGYSFDASLFPSSLNFIARLYMLSHIAKKDREELKERTVLFGPIRNMWMPLKPFMWKLQNGHLLEIPVTTIPGLRFPFHFSNLIWLYSHSRSAGRAYFNFALNLCKMSGVQPSILLHPTDFLGKDSCPGLDFFPGMTLTQEEKLDFINYCLEQLRSKFHVVPMSEFADCVRKEKLKEKTIA